MRWLKYGSGFVAFALLLWMGAAGTLWLIQDRLVFQPDDRLLGDPPAAIARLARETIATTDGLELGFWLASPDPGRPVIVYFHGNGGNAGDRAAALKPLIDDGYGLLLTEYRGFGGNPGKPSESAFYADAAVYVALAGERYPGLPIVIWGESLGAGVATWVATDEALDQALRARIAGIILDAPFTSLRDMAAALNGWLPSLAPMRSRFDNLARIPAIQVSLLILHGEDDWIVPVAQGRRLLEAANDPKTGLFLPGVGHLAFAYDRSGAALAAVEAFLAAIPAGQ
ncbi:MAG: alpha/beta fold hydrolase [Rhodospirillaceae bacterium]|nr:alpha/beta fold hydrolase [Rhodospirillaceae bacterium]